MIAKLENSIKLNAKKRKRKLFNNANYKNVVKEEFYLSLIYLLSTMIVCCITLTILL